ncbi:hypothetical protein BCR39DRAFT_530531 [Naematelia encephala]|uniref:Uncharacterized protein n=1 Tax=Naematelia encephala TaxID=71784 RepID=A0A1Y2B6A1_9TREE|nr:hypothetical protein BCR39DRAFT_530531 [Naematelia encephala]
MDPRFLNNPPLFTPLPLLCMIRCAMSSVVLMISSLLRTDRSTANQGGTVQRRTMHCYFLLATTSYRVDAGFYAVTSRTQGTYWPTPPSG